MNKAHKALQSSALSAGSQFELLLPAALETATSASAKANVFISGCPGLRVQVCLVSLMVYIRIWIRFVITAYGY
jgi:hypothetical protein